jgi:predicted thioesterase
MSKMQEFHYLSLPLHPIIIKCREEMIEIGLKHTSEITVTEAVTAIKMGSGDLPVLATPAMMALMENAAMLAVASELQEGSTTVGGHIESSHLRPSKIGDKVSATAEVTKIDGKKIEFKVSAYSGETLLGEGTHLRFIVDRERFMSKLG